MDAGACDEAEGCNEEDVAVDAGACDEAVGGDEEGLAVDADACDEAEGCKEEDVAVEAVAIACTSLKSINLQLSARLQGFQSTWCMREAGLSIRVGH